MRDLSWLVFRLLVWVNWNLLVVGGKMHIAGVICMSVCNSYTSHVCCVQLCTCVRVSSPLFSL